MWEYTVLNIAGYVIQIYYWVMIAAIFVTWVPAVHQSKIGEWLLRLTDPYFGIFRRFIPPLGVLDISPLIAIFVYRYLTGFALNGLQTVLGWIHP